NRPVSAGLGGASCTNGRAHTIEQVSLWHHRQHVVAKVTQGYGNTEVKTKIASDLRKMAAAFIAKKGKLLPEIALHIVQKDCT
ncbi:14410_t:CDS:1, partial [Acaulospora morrowiae]